jgi:hypothetical protein
VTKDTGDIAAAVTVNGNSKVKSFDVDGMNSGNFKISLVSKLLDSIPIINLKRSQAIINLVIVHY